MDCASCGRANRPTARFCDACGTSLVARGSAGAESRKVVTIVFADLVGSTSLHERLDAESARRLMDRYYRALHTAVEAQGGALVKLLGDGVMAAFGVPRVAEDDAIRAVRAAVAMQRAVRELVREPAVGEIGLRVAVNTGEVVVSDDHTDVVGDPVNVAARLQQEAHDGDVLIGESTQRLVDQLVTLAPFGVLALKGRSDTVAAYRVVSLERPAGTPATAFVGRDDELRRLTTVYERAVAAPGARLAVVLGSPGLGKSRLLGELIRRLGARATVLSARCDAAGGATFAPMAEALRAFLRVDDGAGGDAVRAALEALLSREDSERARIVAGIAGLLAGAPAPPEETFFVVRRLLAAVATTKPVVLAIDDIQWAEPLLLDLTEHLVQWSAGVPLLVVVAARPEVRDARSSLAAPGGIVSDVVTLGGLDAGAATRLAANVIGAEALPAAVAGRVLAASEGNPLFVGELVRMLVHDGALRREGDRWTAGVELADLEMPPTIQALLSARIERLGPEERIVLERAAVVGRHFSRGAVAHLLAPQAQADLDGPLESLRRSELIEADAGWFLGEPALRFHHVLIRDAAYRRLLKGTRAELHARFADWLESRVGDAVEHDETIGWHLEQAHQHLRELGPIDAQGRAFGERAAGHLAAAGRRALARDDVRLAAGLLGRALERLDDADGARADLALDWCEALLAAGDVVPAARAVAELGRFAGDSDRLRAWHTCFAGQLAVLTDPQALRATADAVAAAADTLASAGDAAGEAKAHSVHATAVARLGKMGACEAALDRALAAARRARDRRRANSVLAGAPLAALWGPSPVARASGRCLDVVRVLRITQGAPAVEAVALRCQAVLEALRGRTEAARRMIGSSRRMVEELGIRPRLLEADVFAGLIELLEGDAVAAERCLRGAYEGLRDDGLGIDAAQAAALLGRALLAQGRAAEAEALSHESEALAGDDLKAAIAWRGVRAEALARRGEHVAAVDFARVAVDIAAATDALLDHADARVALAAVLRAAGRGADADAEEARAIELWETKGATLLTERRRDAGHVAPADRAASADPVSRVCRGVRSNAATANVARLDAAVAGRDEAALPALTADDAETVHHPTGVTYDGRAALATWRSLLLARHVTMTHVPVATLGDTLALCRTAVSLDELAGDDFALFGAVENENVLLIEVDAQGRRRRTEFFAADRLADGVRRLYERYADLVPDGGARERAATTVRSIAALLQPPDVERYAGAVTPLVEYADRRSIGLGSGRGAEVFLRGLRSLLEVSGETATRVDDIVALEPDAVLMRWTNFGTDRTGGGAYERQLLLLWVFGSDGRLARFEQFDADRDEEALARFDELTAGPKRAPFTNAASRSFDKFARCWRARDWQGVVDVYAPAMRLIDRRPVTGLDLERGDFLASLRVVFDISGSRWHGDLLATRGERLALFRWRVEGDDGTTGSAEVEYVGLVEVDVGGRTVLNVVFELGAVDAAYSELDDRYAAGEGARYAELLANVREFQRASAARDWPTVARLLPADFTLISHRRLVSTEAPVGRDQYLATRGSMDDLGVRGDLHLDHQLRISPRAAASVWTWYGTLDGGDFEDTFCCVYAHDGKLVHFLELFDVDQLDAALARYDALSTEPTATRAYIANAATRSADRFDDAWDARDWERVAAVFAPGHRESDRRRMARIDLDREQYLAGVRLAFEMTSSRHPRELLATRGDRLALFRMRFEGTHRSIGPSELDWLWVAEVDERGDRIAGVMFDPDDLDAAYAELDARYDAGERASHRHAAVAREFRRAFAERDWDALATTLAPDLVVHDHRVLGWETLHGPGPYVEALRSLVDLAPDARLRIDHVIATSADAVLYVPVWVGTREGGVFEAPSVIVAEFDASGRIRRFDQYDLDRLGEARARLDAVVSRAIEGPLRIPPNAATRAFDRWHDRADARDWEALGALFAPAFAFDDRRRGVRDSGDREKMLASVRVVRASGARVSSTPLATWGDCVALHRLRFTGGDGATPYELDTLQVTEVDAAGRIVAAVTFDPEDRRAASAELRERYARSADVPDEAFELLRAVEQRDPERLRATLPDDFFVHDHRLTGPDRIQGADAYLAWSASLLEQSRDAVIETLYTIAITSYGLLGVSQTFGTLREGGTFEVPFVNIVYYPGGRFSGIEVFELHDLDRARARFEALGADRA